MMNDTRDIPTVEGIARNYGTKDDPRPHVMWVCPHCGEDHHTDLKPDDPNPIVSGCERDLSNSPIRVSWQWSEDDLWPNAGLHLLDAMIPSAAKSRMTKNKATIEKFHNGVRTGHAAIALSCLTKDAEWIVPGAFHAVGKNEIGAQLERETFEDSPTVQVLRMTEENNVVIAEGIMRGTRRSVGMMNSVFCDVFVMNEHAFITRIMSYRIEVSE